MLREKLIIPSVILSSGLFALSFFNWRYGWLIYFFLLPYLLVSNNFLLKKSFVSGWLFGFLAHGLNLIWIIPTIINGGAGLLLAITGWVALSLYCGLYFAIFFWLNKIFAPEFSVGKIIFAASLWVFLEYLRSHLFGGFPFGITGYAPVKYWPLLSPARLGGVYAVSFLIIAFNLTVARFFLQRPKIKTIFVLGFILWLNLSGILSYPVYQDGRDLKVALLQGNIRQEEKFDPDQREKIITIYKNLIAKVSSEKPDIIIWPETAWPDLINNSPGAISVISPAAFQLVGALTFTGGKYYNSALLLDAHQKNIWQHHKTHLVPFGEFVPFRRWLGFIEYFQTYVDITAGKKIFLPAEISAADGQIKLGVTICSENFFPEISRQWARNGVNLLINITNDAWFGNTSALPQHFAMNVLRAVETGRPVVVAGNSGISGIIDQTGKIVSTLPVYQRGFLTGKVSYVRYPAKTFYGEFGNFFVIIILVVIFSGIGRKIYAERIRKKDNGLTGASLT